MSQAFIGLPRSVLNRPFAQRLDVPSSPFRSLCGTSDRKLVPDPLDMHCFEGFGGHASNVQVAEYLLGFGRARQNAPEGADCNCKSEVRAARHASLSFVTLTQGLIFGIHGGLRVSKALQKLRGAHLDAGREL